MTDRARRWARGALEVGLVVLVFVAVQNWRTRDHVPAGDRLPAMQVMTLDGEVISPFPPAGHATLVNFWATWCGVCRQEISTWNAIHEELAAAGHAFYAVAPADDVDTLRAFVAERDIRYPVLIAAPHAASAVGVQAYPSNFYVSPDGHVVSSDTGLSTRWGVRWRLWRASRVAHETRPPHPPGLPPTHPDGP